RLTGGGELLARRADRIAVGVADGVVALEQHRQRGLAGGVERISALLAELGAHVALPVLLGAVERRRRRRIAVARGVADLAFLLVRLAHARRRRELVEHAVRALLALEREQTGIADLGDADEDAGAGVELHRRRDGGLARLRVAAHRRHLREAGLGLRVVELHAALTRGEHARVELVLQRELVVWHAVVLRRELAAVLHLDLGVGAAAERPAALLRGDALDEVVDARGVVGAARGKKEEATQNEGSLHGDEIRRAARFLS